MPRCAICLLVCAFTNCLHEPLQAQTENAYRLIPAGTFNMGGKDIRRPFFKTHSPYNTADESPRHPVRLTKPFYLAKTEVTVAQFRQFVDESKYRTTAEQNGQGIRGFDPRDQRNRKLAFSQKPEFTWKNPGFKQQDNHPVVGVSWQDAQAYCRWLSQKTGQKHRLPTEAEWEYACRAGSDTFFSWGDEFLRVVHQKANIGNVELEKAWPGRVIPQWLIDGNRDPGDPHVTTAPVGSYPANAWALHDMHGNVWEWCEDRYLDTLYTQYKRPVYNQPLQRAIDPLNDKPLNEFGDWRVIRGGSWFTSPVQARSAVRGFFDATDAACYIGFRVARDASADEIATARKQFEQEEESRRIITAAVGKFTSENGTDLRADFNQPQRTVTKHLPNLGGLTEVSMYGNGRLDPAVFQDVAAVPRLRYFAVHHTGPGVTDDHVQPFAQTSNLEVLRLSAMPELTDAGLAHFTRHRNLRELAVNCRRITDAGLKQFAGLKTLEKLHIDGTLSQGGVLRDLADSPLQALYVRRLTDETARSLALFPNLTELRCRDGELTSAGLAHIAGLTKLTNLDLANCKNIEDAGFQALSQLRLLIHLSLLDTQAGDAAVGFTSRMQQLSNLSIGSGTLTDQGLRRICDILTLGSLRLGREATRLTDRGFVDFWRLNRLSYLHIEAPNITGEGFAPLTELKLNRLRLATPALTNRGLRHVSEMPSLRQLWIEGSPAGVTDEGLLYLKDATKLSDLEIIRKGTGITDEAIAELKQALPNARITVR